MGKLALHSKIHLIFPVYDTNKYEIWQFYFTKQYQTP